jgi:large-conductance mechanosensitive channel
MAGRVKKFSLKGNVIDPAIGVIIDAAFGQSLIPASSTF